MDLEQLEVGCVGRGVEYGWSLEEMVGYLSAVGYPNHHQYRHQYQYEGLREGRREERVGWEGRKRRGERREGRGGGRGEGREKRRRGDSLNYNTTTRIEVLTWKWNEFPYLVGSNLCHIDSIVDGVHSQVMWTRKTLQ